MEEVTVTKCWAVWSVTIDSIVCAGWVDWVHRAKVNRESECSRVWFLGVWLIPGDWSEAPKNFILNCPYNCDCRPLIVYLWMNLRWCLSIRSSINLGNLDFLVVFEQKFGNHFSFLVGCQNCWILEERVVFRFFIHYLIDKNFHGL